MTANRRSLRIALLGSRGIPAAYGGYETFFEELSWRLAERGHDVTVYCRSQYTPRDMTSHRGAHLVVLPTWRTKHLDTPVHTLLSSLHTWRHRYDAALLVNGANALFVPLLRLGRLPTALHVDGIEKQRSKWGAFGRFVYSTSERLACRLPNLLVTDAEVIEEHYLERYGARSVMIPYGVDPAHEPAGEVLQRLGLTSRRYFLYVSRFEPENNPHRVAEAYRQVPGDVPLVMVGSAPYADDFIRSFQENADPRVQFPGAIYGAGYRELQSHALAYIQATEVGGTHPALVEAMGFGNCLVVNETPENVEVAGPDALYFDAHRSVTLAEQLRWILEHPDEVETKRRALAERARQQYSWEAVTDRYEQLFQELAEG